MRNLNATTAELPSAPTNSVEEEIAEEQSAPPGLAARYLEQVRYYWPRFQAYSRQGQDLRERFRAAGRQLQTQLQNGEYRYLDQQRSLAILILPVEAGLLLSRHLLAFLEDLLHVGEHRLGLKPTRLQVIENDDDFEPSLPILALTAKPGEKVDSVFVIQNDQDHPVSIELDAKVLVGSTSGPCDSCALYFKPAAVTLAAGANQMIRLTADIDSTARNDTYLSRVEILGMENKAFCIQLQVTT